MKLRSHFKEFQVKQLSDPTVHFDAAHVEKMIVEVTSLDVCSMLCTDQNINDKVNAWLYSTQSNECHCAWLKSTKCDWNDAISDVDANQTLISFLQLSRTLPCSELLLGPISSIKDARLI